MGFALFSPGKGDFAHREDLIIKFRGWLRGGIDHVSRKINRSFTIHEK